MALMVRVGGEYIAVDPDCVLFRLGSLWLRADELTEADKAQLLTSPVADIRPMHHIYRAILCSNPDQPQAKDNVDHG